jgi:hypothetical protein
MTTPNTSLTLDLIALARRMGIPVDEAVSLVARLMENVENANVLRTFCAAEYGSTAPLRSADDPYVSTVHYSAKKPVYAVHERA